MAAKPLRALLGLGSTTDSQLTTAPHSPQPADAAEPKYFQSARVPASLPVLVFLGVDDRPSSDTHATQTPQDAQNPSGPPYFALDLPASAELPASAQGTPAAFSDARSAASHLSAYEAGLFAQARAMIDWNTRNRFCAACGRETYSLWAGWKRGCTSVLEGGKDGAEPCPSTWVPARRPSESLTDDMVQQGTAKLSVPTDGPGELPGAPARRSRLKSIARVTTRSSSWVSSTAQATRSCLAGKSRGPRVRVAWVGDALPADGTTLHHRHRLIATSGMVCLTRPYVHRAGRS